MKFTESQKDFILSCLTTEITNKEILIKDILTLQNK